MELAKAQQGVLQLALQNTSLSISAIYTNAISCNNSLLTLIKYADDMALVACLKDDYSLSQYFLQIKLSFLKLNIAKTKELVFGKGKAGNTKL